MQRAHLLISIVIIFFLPIESNSQSRKNLIIEYKKMINNAAYLGISLPGRIENSSNEKIKDVLEKGWIKKQIIILLQLTGYIENPVCYINDVPDNALQLALQKFSKTNKTSDNLNINSSTRDYLYDFYLHQNKEQSIPQLMRKNSLEYKNTDIIIRVFKQELELELWIKPANIDTEYNLLKTYEIRDNIVSRLGPKSKFGDALTPEGIYSLYFYPAFKWSDFYLAFKISYPNRADKLRRRYWSITGKTGGDINLHGCCVSIGCVPIGNPDMEELFLFLRSNQKNNNTINVHIFPFRYTSSINNEQLQNYQISKNKLYDFWMSLKDIEIHFNSYKKLPDIGINLNTGYYLIK